MIMNLTSSDINVPDRMQHGWKHAAPTFLLRSVHVCVAAPGAASSASPFSFNTTPATGGLFGTSTALVAAGQQQQLQQQQQQQAAAAAQVSASCKHKRAGQTGSCTISYGAALCQHAAGGCGHSMQRREE